MLPMIIIIYLHSASFGLGRLLLIVNNFWGGNFVEPPPIVNMGVNKEFYCEVWLEELAMKPSLEMVVGVSLSAIFQQRIIISVVCMPLLYVGCTEW